MSTFENEQQAAEALIGAIESDRAEREVEPNVNRPAEQVAEPAQPEPTDAGATAEAEQPQDKDSFTQKFRPEDLPEELQPVYRSMQGEFTRRMQDIAEERKQFEALEQYGGIDAVTSALDFVYNLATDPEYQLNVHEQLTAELQRAGMTPAAASQEASRQIDNTINESADDLEFGVDPATERELKSIKDQLAEERAWRERQEEIQFNNNLRAQLDRDLAEVIRDHPSWTDADVNAAIRLSYSTQGDVKQGAAIWDQLKTDSLADYITSKASVTTGGASSPVPSGGYAEQAKKFTDLMDPELEKLAQERLAHELANQ